MSENYCGKSCENCEFFENKSCAGCKEGPGGEKLDFCEVAACCRIKMQDSCEICSSRDVCENIQRHQEVPDYIQEKLKNDFDRDEKIKDRAKVADKWKVLFFWSIAAIVVRTLFSDSAIELFPAFEYISAIGEAICYIAISITVFNMASVIKEYRFAGYCQIIYAVALVLILFLPEDQGIILGLIASIISYVGDCRELKCHGMMFAGIDDEMEGKWAKTHKWFVISCYVLFGSIVVMLVSLGIGVVALLAAGIGLYVLNIIRLVYLYKSANLFKKLVREVEYDINMTTEYEKK